MRPEQPWVRQLAAAPMHDLVTLSLGATRGAAPHAPGCGLGAEGVRAGPETQIGPPFPVAEVVPTLKPRLRPVGDLVVTVAGGA